MPDELAAATKSYFETFGASPEDAGKAFVEGVRKGQFLVSNYRDFSELLVEFAKNGLNPNANYEQVVGKAFYENNKEDKV